MKNMNFQAKITRNIGSNLQLYGVFSGWLFVSFLMVYDYCYEVTHPPTGFIPSSYEPPNFALVVILLTIMGLELMFVYRVLRALKGGHRILRVTMLSILNFFWTILSGLMSGTRPPAPLLWHFGWLLLLEIILVVDVVIFSIRRSIHSLYRAIESHLLILKK